MLSGFCLVYLAVRAVLLSSHVEVVEDAALGGDTLGVGRLVPEPGEGCLAVIPDLRHNMSHTQLSPLRPILTSCRAVSLERPSSSTRTVVGTFKLKSPYSARVLISAMLSTRMLVSGTITFGLENV